MNEEYGEIRLFAGNFTPKYWKKCEGQLLQIENYLSLFQNIGTTYGGDGASTFALPDLRGRVPVGVGSNPKLPNFHLEAGVTTGNKEIYLSEHQIPDTTAGTGSSTGLEILDRYNKASTQNPVSLMQPSMGLNYIIFTG
jgi:microcystin-dependent protein